MEIRIGIVNAPREVVVEMADDASADDVKAAIEAGVAESLSPRRARPARSMRAAHPFWSCRLPEKSSIGTRW